MDKIILKGINNQLILNILKKSLAELEFIEISNRDNIELDDNITFLENIIEHIEENNRTNIDTHLIFTNKVF